MSSRQLAPTLGDAFLAAPADLNDGYPILRWQVPTYTVTFMVDPAGAEVTIDGQTGTHTEGRWVFALPDGTYSYSVRAFGYLEKTGELTVQGGTVDESVTLAAAGAPERHVHGHPGGRERRRDGSLERTGRRA